MDKIADYIPELEVLGDEDADLLIVEMCIRDSISPKQNTILKEVTPEDFMFAGADAFSRQVVKMMNDKLIAPYEMCIRDRTWALQPQTPSFQTGFP